MYTLLTTPIKRENAPKNEQPSPKIIISKKVKN